MKKYRLSELEEKQLDILCERKAIDSGATKTAAESIINEVKVNGDKALVELTRKFDKADISSLEVSAESIKSAGETLSTELKQAFDTAFTNITKFHEAQLSGRISIETSTGVTCFAENRPIEKVGLYVPGGSANLPSTVLMLAIPAKLAGCEEIILCTPPRSDGSVADSILYAASLCGVDRVFRIGGAQAVAAMAYGTETVPKVYKIFGPGNQYVTSAKQSVSADIGGAAVDMPAGPTEVLVVADKTSRADFVAADLLSQAEHGPDSMVVLACSDERKVEDIFSEVGKQIKDLPRKEIVEKALDNSFCLTVDSLAQAIDFANRFAPEHLILGFDSADEWTDKVINAGSVFIGPYSSESAGDYASGTNHSLPTYGYARAYSGVSVSSFQKRVTFQKVTKNGAKNIGPAVSALAAEEGLDAHRRAMEIRL